jgi:hypothetical protein
VKVVQKNVYYCDFCKRHRLTRHAIETHEPHCIYNPQRVCRWNLPGGEHGLIDVAALAVAVKERELVVEKDIVWLRAETDGCPACMLRGRAERPRGLVARRLRLRGRARAYPRRRTPNAGAGRVVMAEDTLDGIEWAEGTRPYLDRMSAEDARQIAREKVAEWDYAADPHGYCHDRPVLVRLLEAAHG